MTNDLYSKTMRNGSRLLFVMAVLLFIAGLLQGLAMIFPLGPENEILADWRNVVAAFSAAMSYPVWPLIGSLLIDRLDRRRDEAGPRARDQ